MARFVLFLVAVVTFFLSGCAYRTTQVIDPAGNRTITTESYYFPTPPGAVRVYRERGNRREYYPDYPRYYRDRDREVCWYTYPYNGDRRRPVLLCH